MRAVVWLLALLFLAAAGTIAAQEKPAIDRIRPGSLNPEPLPPLQNPNAPSTPAKELFARKSKPLRGPPRSIGYYSAGCLAGAVALPMTGPDWQVMRPSRNRNWGHPHLIRYIERLGENAKKVGWNGVLVGDMSQPRGGPMLSEHTSHQIGLDADIWFSPMPDRGQNRGRAKSFPHRTTTMKIGSMNCCPTSHRAWRSRVHLPTWGGWYRCRRRERSARPYNARAPRARCSRACRYGSRRAGGWGVA